MGGGAPTGSSVQCPTPELVSKSGGRRPSVEEGGREKRRREYITLHSTFLTIRHGCEERKKGGASFVSVSRARSGLLV